jgi:hypothetical protein
MCDLYADTPHAVWVFVTDQGHTHQSASQVRRVAHRGGRHDKRGVQGGSGVLHTLASRAAFLRDPTHRIQFVYVPKHTSWLNKSKSGSVSWCGE